MADERAARRGVRWLATIGALLVVGAMWAVVQLAGLGRTPFHTRGEPREAVVVQDLVSHDRWLLPRRNATALPRKPPLFYWLGGVAAQARDGRVDEQAVRLPSAVQSGAAALLLTLVVSSALSPLAGAAAGIVLLTSFEWLRAATAARVDMTLAFGLTLVFLGLLQFRRSRRRGWLLVLWAGAAWATLAKGIPGLAIPALMIALLCVIGRGVAPLRALRPLPGMLAVLVIAGAWYATAAWRAGAPFVDIVMRENFVRITGAESAQLGHAHGVDYLIGMLLAGLLPWTLLLPSVAAALWRARATLTRDDPRLLALCWSAAVFTPYALASSKRGVYLLPLYPAVALLVGWWAAALWRGAVRAPALRYVLAGILWPLTLLLAGLAALAALQWRGLAALDWLPALAAGRTAAHLTAIVGAIGATPELAALAALAACASGAAALAARRGPAGVLLAGLALTTVAVALAARLVVMPAIGAVETRRPFAAALRAAVADPAQVHTVPSLDYGTLYYWGGAMPVYDPRGGVADGPPYLLMPELSWLRASPALRAAYAPVSSLRPPHRNNEGTPVLVVRRAAAAAAAEADEAPADE